MTRRLLLLLLALALGAGAAGYLHDEAGYVLLSWGPWLVETSLLGFAFAMVLGLPLAVYGLKLVVAGLSLPAILRRVLDKRRLERAQESFEAGVQKLMEGQWRRAEIELVRRAADHPNAGLNYLLAARAAQRLAAGDRRDHYLSLAARHGPDGRIAAALSRAELQLQRGELEPARAALRALHEQDPRHPYVVELLAETLAQTADWEELRVLLVRGERLKALPAERAQGLLRRAVSELMQAAVRDARLDALKQAWDGAPAALRNEPAMRRAYAQCLARLNAHAEAAAQIATALKQGWDGELVLLFGELEAADAVSQLATVEHWLHEFGEQYEVLLVAGRACQRNKLWGKARSYLEAAARLKPSAAVYLELAKLCESTQAQDEAARFYRRGLELAAART